MRSIRAWKSQSPRSASRTRPTRPALRRVAAARLDACVPAGDLLVADVATARSAPRCRSATVEVGRRPVPPHGPAPGRAAAASARGTERRRTGARDACARPSVNSPSGLPRPKQRLARPSTRLARRPQFARGRESPHRAPDPLRHLRRRGHPQGRRVRRRAGSSRATSRSTSSRSAACRCWPRRSGRRRARRSSSTATSTSSRRARSSSSPRGRGRSHLRPRRLRHEGRAGGDDGRAPGAARRSAACGCCSRSSRTRSPRRRSTAAPSS